MKDFDEAGEAPLPIQVYQCGHGCFHIISGNFVLRFSRSQFISLAKAVYGALEQTERKPASEENMEIAFPNERIM
jgi:hypothetical protein